MMNAVIDANVVVGYFRETVLRQIVPLTEQPGRFFHGISTGDVVVFVDKQGNMEHEWRERTDREWFDAWYGDLLRDGHAYQIPGRPQQHLEKRLRLAGFPGTTRDKWYVRTSATAAAKKGEIRLVTEDLDFYEPSEARNKDPERRRAFLVSSDGSVARILREASVRVCCVATAYLACAGTCSPL